MLVLLVDVHVEVLDELLLERVCVLVELESVPVVVLEVDELEELNVVLLLETVPVDVEEGTPSNKCEDKPRRGNDVLNDNFCLFGGISW